MAQEVQVEFAQVGDDNIFSFAVTKPCGNKVSVVVNLNRIVSKPPEQD
jgi:hypothetical protein